MMSTVLTLSQPSVLVELRSRFAKKNYKANLKSYLNQTCKSPCEYLQFNAIPESISAKDMRAKDLWGIPEPKKLRDISILAYFGQCAGSGNKRIKYRYYYWCKAAFNAIKLKQFFIILNLYRT